MGRVILVNQLEGYRSVLAPPQENLGVACLASSLGRDGHEVLYVDGVLASLSNDEIWERIRRQVDGSVLCFAAMAYDWLHAARALLDRVAAHEGKPKLVVLGGAFMDFGLGEAFALCPEADVAILGEGEAPLRLLVQCVDEGSDWSQVPSIATLDGQELRRTAPAQVLELDGLPFPDRSHLPRLTEIRAGLGLGPEASVQTSRGCYGECAFCASSAAVGGDRRGYRARSAQNVFAELCELADDHGVQDVAFIDEVFVGRSAGSRRRALQLADLIEESSRTIRFSIYCRPDDFDSKILSRLRAVGLSSVFVGFETFHEPTLRLFRRPGTPEQYVDILGQCQRLDLQLVPGLIMVHPFSTIEEVVTNIDALSPFSTMLAGRAWRGPLLMSELRLFEGTPLVALCRKEEIPLRRNDATRNTYDYRVDPQVWMYRKVMVELRKMTTHAPICGEVIRRLGTGRASPAMRARAGEIIFGLARKVADVAASLGPADVGDLKSLVVDLGRGMEEDMKDVLEQTT